MRALTFASLLIIVLSIPLYGGQTRHPFGPPLAISEASHAKYIRTELYFGRNIPNGGTVSDEDWQKFVDDVVTPRFPDGLTILDAYGQWRGKNGKIVREQSKVIILLYPRRQRKTMNVKIEEIRAEYKRRFAQESVMRIDVTKSVEVRF